MQNLIEKLLKILNDNKTDEPSYLKFELFDDSSSLIYIDTITDKGIASKLLCAASDVEDLNNILDEEDVQNESIDYETKYLEACKVITHVLGIEWNPDNFKTHNSHEYFFDEIARLYQNFLLDNSTYDSDDILPCPFCGNEHLDVVEKDIRSEHGAVLFEYMINCESCAVQFGPFSSAKQLVEEWNKRNGK